MVDKNTIKFWFAVLIIGIVLYLIASSITGYLDIFREHGQGAVSVFVTATGRPSQNAVLQSSNIYFVLFSTFAFTILFYLADKKKKKAFILALISLILFLVGFFLSLYWLLFINLTGSAITYGEKYALIKLGVEGIGFLIVSLIILKNENKR